MQRLMERLGAEHQSMPQPPQEQLSIARKKSKRQFAADFAGIIGLVISWWLLMEPRDVSHVIIGFFVFVTFLFCCWSLVDDILDKHKKAKITVMVFFSVVFIGVESAKIYNRMYRPNFCYAFMTIPPTPNREGLKPYVLSLDVAIPESIENVDISVVDISGIPIGGAASDALKKQRSMYLPIVYATSGVVTTMDMGCDGQKEYLINMDTKLGSFSEVLKCSNNNVEDQTLSISKEFPTPKELVTDWHPVNNKPPDGSRGWLIWFLDLCD
jgi:hypothetical protein